MRHIEELIARQLYRWNSITQALAYVPGSPESSPACAPPPGRVHPVICLSRTMGAGARAIAQGLCDRLGYAMFGTEIINELAREMHLQRSILESLDERTLSNLTAFVENMITGKGLEREGYLLSLIRVQRALAAKGGLVLIGRGACHILSGEAALTVLITGSRRARLRRMMRYHTLSEAECTRKMDEHDRERDRFVRQYFNCDVHNALNYDLCLNTDHLAPEACVEIILRAIEARGYDLAAMHLPQEAAAV